jgi:hypothetical protein
MYLKRTRRSEVAYLTVFLANTIKSKPKAKGQGFSL